MIPEVKIITTEDGSHTIYRNDINETYHSFHGAIQESQHVFIKEGLQHLIQNVQPSHISLLEIGFGTGLNTLLTALQLHNQKTNIEYHTLEPHPLNKAVIQDLNYSNLLPEAESRLFYNAIHECKWEVAASISSNLILTKFNTTLQQFLAPHQYDLIYFDAFAPSKQAEMWGPEVLGKAVSYLKTGGKLVTYCAKGQFKRDLGEMGLIVETLAGPPGKKEMVRASKQ